MGSYWQPEILADVVQLVKEGRLYLFAGAGLSCLVGYPSSQELLRRFATAYKALPNRNDAIANVMDDLVKEYSLNIPQHLIDLGKWGEEAFVEILRESFEEQRTSDVHRTLIKMPFVGYVTINYDRCFEKAVEEIDVAEELLRSRWFCFPKHRRAPQSNLDEIYDGKRFLLHMHGCLYYEGRIDTQNIILTQGQYCKFYTFQEMNRIYNDLFYHPFLILGTSLSDHWFMDKLFEARRYDRDSRSESCICYVVRPFSEKRPTDPSDEDIYGIKFNYFDKNDKMAIENMIKELKDKYEQTVRA